METLQTLLDRSLFATGLADIIEAEGPYTADLIRNDPDTYLVLHGEDADMVLAISTALQIVSPTLPGNERARRYSSILTCYASTMSMLAHEHVAAAYRIAA